MPWTLQEVLGHRVGWRLRTSPAGEPSPVTGLASRVAPTGRPTRPGQPALGGEPRVGLCEPSAQVLAGVVGAAHGLPEAPPQAGLPATESGCQASCLGLGQGGGWAGSEAAGTKQGLSGLGPERRPRPCSAASEGPVFQSGAAGSPPRAKETALLFWVFFPAAWLLSLRAPGGRWASVSSLCPGLDRGL